MGSYGSQPAKHPAGISLGRAFDFRTGMAYDDLRQTIALIDRVHGDGKLPSIPVRLSAEFAKRGSYRFQPASGEAISIMVRANQSHRQFAFLHEIGHFLDWMIFGAGSRFGSSTHPSLGNWRRAVTDSGTYRALRAMAHDRIVDLQDVKAGQTAVRLSDDQVALVSRWLLVEELWARSYAQFVVLHAHDSDLLASLEAFHARRPGEVYYPIQWTDEDFVPIASAIDDLFHELGWRT